MTFRNTKTTLSLLTMFIAATLVFAITTQDAYAETRQDKIDRLGQKGVELKGDIYSEENKQKQAKLIDELDDIKQQMRGLGIPTVQEYEDNKEFWRNMAIQAHLNEEDKKQEQQNVSYQEMSYMEVQCSNYCAPPIAKFQAAYAYDCWAGIWACHAYAPVWEYLEEGEDGDQILHIGNPHDWIDPFWIVKGNQAMHLQYDWEYDLKRYNAVVVTDDGDDDIYLRLGHNDSQK